MKFRSDVAGTITGVRFYKGRGSTGKHTGTLWTAGGTLLATGTFVNETASGWQELLFSTPVPISANTTYIASYHANNGFAVDVGYFVGRGVDSAPLHALKAGVDGANGVYVYAANRQFPSNASTISTDLSALGSTHTIATTGTQPGSTGTQYLWNTWSDGGALSHSIVVQSSPTNYIANFVTQYYLTTTANPAEGGSISPASGWYAANTPVAVSATPNSTYSFMGFSGALSGAGSPQALTLAAPAAVSAAFTSATTSTIVTTNPTGLPVTVDGTICTTPCSFQWAPVSQHTIASTATIPGTAAGMQYAFTGWSDGGSLTHSITVSASPATYTGQFKTQYYLTTSVSPAGGGAIIPQAGWYDSGASLQLSATPASGYTFAAFSGDVTSTTTPQTVSVTAPTKVAAIFGTTAVTGTVYTVCAAGCTHTTITRRSSRLAVATQSC